MRHRGSPFALAGVAALLAGLVVLAVLSGCPRSPEREQPTGPAAIPKTVVALWTIWNTEPRKSALDEIVAAFEQAYPEYDIQVTDHEPDAYKTSLRVQLGSAEPPDIFFVWDGEWLQNFVRAGVVYDLTSAMDAANGEWKKRFQPEGLRRFTHSGRVWGIPYLLQCTFFFYNTELFAKHKLVVPHTWPELIKVVDKLRRAGVIPIALGNQQRWPAHHFVSVLFQRLMGEKVVEEDYDPLGPGDYAEPGWIEGMKLFEDFLKHRPFNDAPNAVTRDSARALFYSGKAAMFYTGTWDFSRLREGGDAPRDFWDKWDFFNFPAVPGAKGEQEALTGAPDGYVVSARSRHPEAAVEFLKFMTTVEQARTFVGKCQELVQIYGAVTKENANPHLRKYADMVAAAEVICPWTDTLMERSVADEFLNGIQALLDGQTTSEATLDKVRRTQAQVKQRLLAEQKKR